MQFSLKYRPKKFSEVIGHGYLISALKNSVILNRVPNALIFSGPKGVGKTSISRIFAKALNCPNFTVLKDVCNECSGCVTIQGSKALDYIEIDAASHRGIDEIRSLEKVISLKNFSLNYKVIVLDESHMITLQAWNALLKTIEELPQNIKIILATTDSDKLPPTIISRCQRFDFNSLSKKHITDNLKKICNEEKISFSENVLNRIAHYSKGSLRDAQILLEQVFVVNNAVNDVDTLFNILGTCKDDDIAELFDYIVSSDSKKVFDWLDKNLPTIYNINAFCDELLDYVDKLICQKYIDKPIDGSNMYQFKIKSQIDKLDIEKLILISKILLELKSKLYYFDNTELLVKTFLLKLSMVDNFVDLTALQNLQVDKVVSSVQGKVDVKIDKKKDDFYQKSDVEEVVVQDNAPISPVQKEEWNDSWVKILLEVKNKHILTYNMLKTAKLLEMNDKLIKLGYTNKNNEQFYFKKDKAIETLKNSIYKITGKRLEIVFEMMDNKIIEEFMGDKSFEKFFNTFKGKVEIE